MTQLCNESLDTDFQLFGVSADNVADLLTILEEEERGHGAHAQFGGRLGEMVNVDLVELGLGESLAELGHLRGNGLARAAPRGEAVEDDYILRVENLFLELSVPIKASLVFNLLLPLKYGNRKRKIGRGNSRGDSNDVSVVGHGGICAWGDASRAL